MCYLVLIMILWQNNNVFVLVVVNITISFNSINEYPFTTKNANVEKSKRNSMFISNWRIIHSCRIISCFQSNWLIWFAKQSMSNYVNFYSKVISTNNVQNPGTAQIFVTMNIQWLTWHVIFINDKQDTKMSTTY